MADGNDVTIPVEISTDGACLGNPGPGGWGAVLRYKNHEKRISGPEPATTNNRMELTAAIKGLEAVTKRSTVILYTDSTYVRNGIMKWAAGWQANGWQTKDKSRSRTVNCGVNSLPSASSTTSSGGGSRATQATSTTRSPTNWRHLLPAR